MIRMALLLMALAAAAGVLYMYLLPMITPETVHTYAAYTVRRGSIGTENSYSATISIASSETHKNTSRATMIREIYVKNGQEVRKGDKLMQLDNGEVLRAGLDGVVTAMRFDTTDWLWNNVDLIQICDLTNLKVSLSVDEYDVRNVSAGQKCHVTIVPTGEVYETEISHVDRVSSSAGQVAFYTVSADLTAPESVLPGMTASVTIASDRVEDALLLDMAALAFDEEKQPYVLRQTSDGYQRLKVTTGLSDGLQVQILSGLEEGDIVWAVAGTEAAARTFTLTDLYKRLFGEKIVINDMTGSDRNTPGGGSRMPSPDGSREAPRQTRSPAASPAAARPAESAPAPDMIMPTASPAHASPEDGKAADGAESTERESPRSRNQDGKETQ